MTVWTFQATMTKATMTTPYVCGKNFKVEEPFTTATKQNNLLLQISWTCRAISQR